MFELEAYCKLISFELISLSYHAPVRAINSKKQQTRLRICFDMTNRNIQLLRFHAVALVNFQDQDKNQ
jgi:hypothetical protein